MPFTIDLFDPEIACIEKYFRNPTAFIAEADRVHFVHGLPDGLKLTHRQPMDRTENTAEASPQEKASTRDKDPVKRALAFFRQQIEQEDDWEALSARYFILPGASQGAQKIPLLMLDKQDSGLHSCTWVNGQLYFHQACTDNRPTILPEESDDEESRSPFTPHLGYLKKAIRDRRGHKITATVKHMFDLQGNTYVLKSTPLPAEQPCTLIPHCLASLYIASFIRHGKQIDIMWDQGPSLQQFFINRFTDEHKDFLAEALLQALDEVHQQGIVLTDISASNICLRQNADDPFYTPSFIDDSEAYQGANPHTSQNKGCGTVGYQAPEFYHHPYLTEGRESFLAWQESLAENGTLFTELKSNAGAMSSTASDCFALGCILLNDLQLPPTAQHYPLAQQLCATAPEERQAALAAWRMNRPQFSL